MQRREHLPLVLILQPCTELLAQKSLRHVVRSWFARTASLGDMNKKLINRQRLVKGDSVRSDFNVPGKLIVVDV